MEMWEDLELAERMAVWMADYDLHVEDLDEIPVY